MACGPYRESRRRDERLVSIFKVAKLRGDRGDALCIVRNLSQRGARIETNFSLTIDQRLELQVRADLPIGATVRWSADGSAGVEFDNPVDPQDFIGGISDELRPARPPRFDTSGYGHVVTARQRTKVFVENISLSGAALALIDPVDISPDDVTELSLDGLGEITALVRWVKPDRIGVKFCSAIHFRRLAAWLGAGSAVGFPGPTGETGSA